MKSNLLVACTLIAGGAMAQNEPVVKATITTTMTVIAPDEEDVSNIQTQDAGRGTFSFRNFGDGETKSTTYIKGDMVKTVSKTDMGRTTIIRDNGAKRTTTLLEIMGNKTGFYATDEEQAAMRKSMDSAMRARSKDSMADRRTQNQAPPEVNLSVTNETKKIAGYNCKKAYLITNRILGIKDTATIWFTPDVKMNMNILSFGGGMAAAMGFGGGNANSSNGFDKVDGFIMRYETKMRRNRTMIVEVNKIDLAKDIADKEFEIPKDFDVKPMKEMRTMMGGNGGPGMQMEIRRERNGN